MSRESVVEFVKKAAADAALLGELEAAQSRAAVDVAARCVFRAILITDSGRS